MKFITLDGQIVDCEVLKERKFLWWTQVLVRYRRDVYDYGVYRYTETRAKWINKNKLVED